MTDLVVGHGEVGSALAEILRERYEVHVLDPPKGLAPPDGQHIYDWVHVCVPYGEDFVRGVCETALRLRPRNMVVHSTVPVGTTALFAREVAVRFYYSPVRGIHPHLARYMREFPKWYASEWSGPADAEFADHFGRCGIQVRRAPGTDVLEWMKLLETTEYGYRIVLWQEIERMALNLGPDALGAAKQWLYEKRKVYDGDRGLAPIMYGGNIGGHCVKENWELLKPQMSPEFYTWLTTSQRRRAERNVQ